MKRNYSRPTARLFAAHVPPTLTHPTTPTPHPCSPRSQEELRQERSRVSKLQSEKQALEMQVAVAEQKAQTQVRRTPPSDPATPEESGGSVAAALPALPPSVAGPAA